MESVMKGGWLMVDEWIRNGMEGGGGGGINQLARRNFCSLPPTQAVT